MKIVITITAAEISTLIQLHLAKEGMKVNVEDIKYSKGQAVVIADAPMNIKRDVHASIEETLDVTEHVAAQPMSTPPPLAVVDGGAAEVDMAGVFAASQKIASTTEGKFPTPKHHMLEGESHEWPGDKS